MLQFVFMRNFCCLASFLLTDARTAEKSTGVFGEPISKIGNVVVDVRLSLSVVCMTSAASSLSPVGLAHALKYTRMTALVPLKEQQGPAFPPASMIRSTCTTFVAWNEYVHGPPTPSMG